MKENILYLRIPSHKKKKNFRTYSNKITRLKKYFRHLNKQTKKIYKGKGTKL